MQNLTVVDLMRVAKNAKGKRLPAIGGRAHFKVVIRSGRSGEHPVFIPESTGRERKATNQRRLEEVVAIYNRTGSLKIRDYEETGSQNLSYILRLVQVAADEKRAAPGLPGREMPAIDVYIRRAQFFLSHYRIGGHSVEYSCYLLAIAVHACDSAREELSRRLDQMDDSAQDIGDKKKLRALRDEAGKLPRANLIERIRNQDVHGSPIPFSDPRHVADVMITGSVRPMMLSSSGGVAVSLSVKGGKPEVRRSPKRPSKAPVKLGDAVSYHLEHGRHLVCDFAAGNSMIDLHQAVEEALVAMCELRKKL